MTVPSTQIKARYEGDSVTIAFAYGWKITDEEHIGVAYTDDEGTEFILELGTDYTVAGVGNENGGTVTLIGDLAVTPPAEDEFITIFSTIPLTQNTDFPDNGIFPEEAVEDALDKGTRIDQQMDEILARAIKIPVSDPTSAATELPTVQQRANKYAAFDADGAIFASTSLPTWRGDWQSGATYFLGDGVRDGSSGNDTKSVYICTVQHVSGVWATDLAAGRWTIIIDVPQLELDSAGTVRISGNDTIADYIETKLLVTGAISLSTQNDGGNETRTIAADPDILLADQHDILEAGFAIGGDTLSGTIVVPDLVASNFIEWELTDASTLNFPSTIPGKGTWIIWAYQDGSGGNDVTFDNQYIKLLGSQDINLAPNALNVITLVSNGVDIAYSVAPQE